jgi:dihydrofolate reductase
VPLPTAEAFYRRGSPEPTVTFLTGDVASAIGELKAKSGGELQVHGSGSLVRWLLDNHLVDEMTLPVCPVVVGQGTRLFSDSGPDIALDLVSLRAYPKGITIQVYWPGARSMQRGRPTVRAHPDQSHPRGRWPTAQDHPSAQRRTR